MDMDVMYEGDLAICTHFQRPPRSQQQHPTFSIIYLVKPLWRRAFGFYALLICILCPSDETTLATTYIMYIYTHIYIYIYGYFRSSVPKRDLCGSSAPNVVPHTHTHTHRMAVVRHVLCLYDVVKYVCGCLLCSVSIWGIHRTHSTISKKPCNTE